MQAALAHPLDSKGCDGFEEFAGAIRIADDIVIDKKDVFIVNISQFLDNFLRWTAPVSALEDCPYRAEIALKRTSPAGFN
jgi:hypothetical protein